MSYFAAAVVRAPQGWVAEELELSEVADIEDVVEKLRDVGNDASLVLLFVESDDAYFTLLRLDEGEDLRVFCSDGTFAEESRLGALLLGEVEEPAFDFEEDPGEVDQVEDEPEAAAAPAAVAGAEVDPVGDPDLLSDLGISAHRLLSVCGQEGMLPSDMTAEICQLLGCGDEVEELREA
ncbi:MAG: tRNA adenosine deaminase-associated protein [Micromonosporaceae bacterium]|nr:tRNA adenosine deaminase-associated protein [Micromonosporaceae bacterium]